MSAEVPVFGLMLMAPLSGVSKNGDGTIHAVTMKEIGKLFKRHGKEALAAACGVQVSIIGSGIGVALWPPRVKGIEGAKPRCRKCYELTGRPRLRSSPPAAGQERRGM